MENQDQSEAGKNLAGGSGQPKQVSQLEWHLIPKEEQERVLKSGIKVGTFMATYAQPDWCQYPEALSGQMGCWSLMTPDAIRKRGDCTECDCSADYKEETTEQHSSSTDSRFGERLGSQQDTVKE